MKRLALGLAAALVFAIGCERETAGSSPGVPASVYRPPAEWPPPKLGSLEGFELTNQDGEPFGSEQLRGQVWVAAFFFTRCPTVCPKLTRRMKTVQDQAGKKLRLVSFSVDPEHDQPPVLRDYAKEYGADLATWSFLTGDYEVIKRTTVEGFKMALDGKANPSANHYGILHGSHLVLVDKALDIRGYYRSDEDLAVAELIDHGRRLAAEI